MIFDTMAAKRFLNDEESDRDPSAEKRKRPRPSFASVIGEVVMVNSLQNLCSALEPVLRKVVHEEVERCLRLRSRSFTRSSSFRIQALEPSSLQLIFPKSLLLPIFTGSKILDIESNPLQLLIVDTSNGGQMVPATLSQSVKVEIIVLDGDFLRPEDGENWTAEQFNAKIVKERTGKRPLLRGDLNFTMREGGATIGDIEFTDNSSWIRSRKFRLGARVVPGSSYQGVRIREAMTEAFTVKDHRGELYKKHHPPMLEDDVWRLEKIGKDGAFHKKLSQEGIKTVQDFLKTSVVDEQRLKRILGMGMSEKMWDATLKHAKTCVIGTKQYILRGPNYFAILNPICEVVRATINDQIYTRGLTNFHRAHIANLEREAYTNWDSLEEVDALNETILLTQDEMVEQYPSNNQAVGRTIQQSDEYPVDNSMVVRYGQLSDGSGSGTCNDWCLNSTAYIGATIQGGIQYHLTGSPSDGDSQSSRIFFNGS